MLSYHGGALFRPLNIFDNISLPSFYSFPFVPRSSCPRSCSYAHCARDIVSLSRNARQKTEKSAMSLKIKERVFVGSFTERFYEETRIPQLILVIGFQPNIVLPSAARQTRLSINVTQYVFTFGILPKNTVHDVVSFAYGDCSRSNEDIDRDSCLIVRRSFSTRVDREDQQTLCYPLQTTRDHSRVEW